MTTAANDTPPPDLFSPYRQDWRQARVPTLGKKKRYPFLISAVDRQPRPFVFLKIVSDAAPTRFTVMPGLIDSGAHTSLAPRGLCARLGLDLCAAPRCAPSAGIGGLEVPAYAHSFVLGIYDTPQIDARSIADFGPFPAGLQILNSDFPYVLLGQNDFLSRFHYSQSTTQGWFELQWHI